VDLEDVRQPAEGVNGDIELTTFDSPHIGALETGLVGEGFLREAARMADCAEASADFPDSGMKFALRRHREDRAVGEA
jgi:hypothetical protein